MTHPSVLASEADTRRAHLLADAAEARRARGLPHRRLRDRVRRRSI